MKLQLFCFYSRNNLTRLDIESLLGVDSKKAVRVLNKLIDKSLVVSEGGIPPLKPPISPFEINLESPHDSG